MILTNTLNMEVISLDDERLINPELVDINEERMENSLRPKTLAEYIGQDKVKRLPKKEEKL